VSLRLTSPVDVPVYRVYSLSMELNYGYAVYVFPKNLPWFDTGFYLSHLSDCVGYAAYYGEFPPAQIPSAVLEMYPGETHDYITSPRVWDENGKVLPYGGI
jgi:hypothetical protein